MKKALVSLVAVGLLVTACGGRGASPDIIIPTSGDALDRVEYSESQIETYKDALTYETLKLNPVEGMTLETDVPDEQWAPYIVRAKSFCDDARTNGWSSAIDTYTAQVIDEAMNAMPETGVEFDLSDPIPQEIIDSLLNTQLRAIAAEGSLCPELAPEGFAGTVIDADSPPTPAEEPLLEGKYFGEGCEGAGNALLELLDLIQGMEDGSTKFETFEEDITNIASGLRYASLSESNSNAASAIDGGVDALVGLLIAFDSGDGEEFAAQIGAVSEQAVRIIDVCDLR